ncbi:MAG: DNA polymerase III subunit epsilon [Rhodospirillales bacterium]|nr:DNA polymerase III subunit epsilon [Rhodospirillales bacterium]
MFEIVLDTETTGLDPSAGHRIVEIGCVELENHLPTGRTYHQYINPKRDMPAEAYAVHGLSEEFLAGQPEFGEVVDDFLTFIGDVTLVIHNADFDMGFINAELTARDLDVIPRERAVDTVAMARRKFPGARANLDSLCQRFGIDNSDREMHGALKDSYLLSAVYLELIGGRQPGLELKSDKKTTAIHRGERKVREPRPHAPSAEEVTAHAEFIGRIEKNLWYDGGK